MATKIRLQRHGRKSYAFYSIVIADSRAPRDGKFTEKLGTYNPNTNPATVDLNFESALSWVLKGAQPTDTVRNILSNEGIYMKKHLLGGVAKGAFGEAEAEAKFEAWKANKQTGLATLKAKQEADAKADLKARFEAEKKINEAKAKILAEKKAAEEAANAPAPVVVKEAPVEEVAAPVAEEVVAAVETPAAPVVEEAPVAETAAEAKAE
ncbi:30S ribosomal protein S16 [uncultured Bacteroides sp.]|uniref:30S ribosomal protein S16 n=1 Tax=uncultured Bacteroides sp. TaxID=162156 RepID=UPI002AA934AB|nr:30S ribosomal protein S16 [uncultured Bacteroides sp.]